MRPARQPLVIPLQNSLKYRKKRVIFAQGELADSVFYLQEGAVKLTVASTIGKTAVIAVLGPGAFLGEGCLAGQTQRTATCTTLCECTVLRLRPAALAEKPWEGRFLAFLLSRAARFEADLADQIFNSCERRLARQLLLLAGPPPDSQPRATVPKISQETLAELVGSTRPRISFFMNKFRRLGYIDYGRELEIHSSLSTVLQTD
jgi:CRP-like cAMP-binding protein